MESKAIQGLAVMGTAGVMYTNWKERLENAILLLRPHYARILEYAFSEKDKTATFQDFEDFLDLKGSGRDPILWRLG